MLIYTVNAVTAMQPTTKPCIGLSLYNLTLLYLTQLFKLKGQLTYETRKASFNRSPKATLG